MEQPNYKEIRHSSKYINPVEQVLAISSAAPIGTAGADNMATSAELCPNIYNNIV